MELSTLFENAHNAYMLFDMDGICIYANKSADALFCESVNLSDNKYNVLLEAFKSVAAHKEGRRFYYEVENVRFSVTADPCFEDGECNYIMFCFSSQDSAFAKKANEFMANVAHEIKRPLAIMSAYADTLAKQETACADDKIKTACTVIKNESDRLAKLIDDMRELIRVQSGDLKIRTEPLHITYSLLNSKKLFAQNALANGVKLIYNVHQKHAIAMFEDEERLYQLLTVLFDNALKFTGVCGEIEIGIVDGNTVLDNINGAATVAFSNADFNIATLVDKICVYVKDNGCGIAKENINKIFDRGFSYSKTGNKSSGIGLALAKTYMAAMGETVIVISEEGRGTEFYLTMQKCKINEKNADSLKALEPTIEKMMDELER